MHRTPAHQKPLIDLTQNDTIADKLDAIIERLEWILTEPQGRA